MRSFPVRRLLPIPSARRQKLRAVSSADADLRAHETTLFRHLRLFLCHMVAFCTFKVNDPHEIVGSLCRSAQKTVFSSFGRKKRIQAERKDYRCKRNGNRRYRRRNQSFRLYKISFRKNDGAERQSDCDGERRIRNYLYELRFRRKYGNNNL